MTAMSYDVLVDEVTPWLLGFNLGMFLFHLATLDLWCFVDLAITFLAFIGIEYCEVLQSLET